MEFIPIKMDLTVGDELYQEIGISKYDLIIKILDEFLQERNFSKLHWYVRDPYGYAREWMKRFGNYLIFSRTNGETHYSKLANYCVDEIITEVKSSAEIATKEALNISVKDQDSTSERDQERIKLDQHRTWIRVFCKEMRNTAPIDPASLEVTTNYRISHFAHISRLWSRVFKSYKKV